MSSSETLLSSHTACATPSRGPALLRFDSSQPLSLTQSLLQSHPTVQLRRSSLHALDPVYVCNSQPSSMGSPLRSHKSSLQLLLDFFISADNFQTSPSLSFLPTYLPILGPHCFSGTTVLVPLASGGSPSDSFKFINMPFKMLPTESDSSPLLWPAALQPPGLFVKWAPVIYTGHSSSITVSPLSSPHPSTSHQALIPIDCSN